jgi:L-lactate utilization protein LutB
MLKLIANMKERGINAYFVKDKEEAKEKALSLIQEGSSIGYGGSVTLESIRIFDSLKDRTHMNLFDKSKCSTPEELWNLYTDMLSADVYLSGANAITEKGQIVNVDGRGNRVAATIFGPKKVIIVAGKNKIVPDIDSAYDRIRKIAIPKNMERLKKLGKKDWTEDNMWGQVSIIERQKQPDRMYVIIVDEELGY